MHLLLTKMQHISGVNPTNTYSEQVKWVYIYPSVSAGPLCSQMSLAQVKFCCQRYNKWALTFQIFGFQNYKESAMDMC